MSKTAKPATPPTSLSVGSGPTTSTNQNTGQQFIVMALTMSWQLAVVVLIPVLAGVGLDKMFDTKYIFTLIGLALALVGMGGVLWRTLQVANRVPVPKLTDKQKRDIQKSYEEDDDQ